MKQGIVVDVLFTPLLIYRLRFMAGAKADHENLYLSFGRPWKAVVAVPWQDVAISSSRNPFSRFKARLIIGRASKIRVRMKQRHFDKLILMRDRAAFALPRAHSPSPTEVFIEPRHRANTDE